MGEKTLEQILNALRDLKQRIIQQEERIAQLEQKLNFPTYEYQSSLKQQLSSKKAPHKTKKFNWQKFESDIGKYVLQIVGIGVFLIGMGFLLHYSITMGWLTPWRRIGLGLVTATGLIALAELLRKKFAQWSIGCSAGGIILYYLSFYIAYDLYKLISPHVAFGAFIAITIASCTYALWRDSRVLTILSAIGGFVTPWLLIGQFSPWSYPVFFASYLFLLTCGYFIVAYIKKWYSLPAISFVFLVFYYITVFSWRLVPLHGLIFLLCVRLLYTVLPFVYALVTKSRKAIFESLSIAASGIFVFWALYYKIVTQKAFFSIIYTPESPIALFKNLALLVGISYLVLYGILYWFDKKNRYVLNTLLSLVVGFTSIWIWYQFYAFVQCGVFYCVGLALFALSFYIKEYYLRCYAYLMWAFASAYLLWLRMMWHVINSSLWKLNFAVITGVVVFVAAAYLIEKNKKQLSTYEKYAPTILQLAAMLIPFYWLHTPFWCRSLYIIICPTGNIGLIVYALIVFIIGLLLANSFIRKTSYWLYGISIVYFLSNYRFGRLLHPYYGITINVMFIAFVATLASAYCFVYYYKKNLSSREKQLLPQSLMLLSAFFLFLWGVSDIILYFDHLQSHGSVFLRPFIGYSVKNDILVRTQLTEVFLAIYYSISAVIIILVGFWTKERLLRYFGLFIVLCALYKLWFIIMRLNYTTHKIIAFILAGILITIASFIYQRLDKRIR